MCQKLSNHREIWKNKPVLRAIYHDFYRRILDSCDGKPVLEIGSGSGNLKEYFDDTISIDILYATWLDTVADAQSLPFKSNSIKNIIIFDVLHHIENPKLFFFEASRILKPNGRIIILEPGITPISYFFYNYLHHEAVKTNINPLLREITNLKSDPYDSNQAIPTLIFDKYRNDFDSLFPDLKVVHKEWLSLFAYPMSGGFQKWQLITERMIRPILKLERYLLPFIGKIAAFRIFIILEKNGREQPSNFLISIK